MHFYLYGYGGEQNMMRRNTILFLRIRLAVVCLKFPSITNIVQTIISDNRQLGSLPGEGQAKDPLSSKLVSALITCTLHYPCIDLRSEL